MIIPETIEIKKVAYDWVDFLDLVWEYKTIQAVSYIMGCKPRDIEWGLDKIFGCWREFPGDTLAEKLI